MSTQTDLEAILADLERAVTADVAPAARRRRLRPQRRFALALALALAAAAALYVGLGVGNEPPASAARQLQHAARLVASTPAPVIGPGRYWYVKGTGAFVNEAGTAAGTFTALQTSSHEIWIASDASGRIVRSDGAPQFFSDAERALGGGGQARLRPGPRHRRERARRGDRVGLGVARGALGRADPHRSRRARAARRPACDGDEESARPGGVRADLRRAPLRAALGRPDGAAFYQVLATLPGIELAGPAEDALGRPGTAFAVERGDPLRSELILDTATGRLLGSRMTLAASDPAYAGVPVGTTIGYETIVATGVVGSTDARP